MQNGPAPSAESTESNLQAVGVGVRSEEERGSACMQCRVAGASCSSWGAPPPSLRRWSLVADRAARSCSLLYAKCQRTKDKGQKGRRGPHCRERGGDPAAGYRVSGISDIASRLCLCPICYIAYHCRLSPSWATRGPSPSPIACRYRRYPGVVRCSEFGVRSGLGARRTAQQQGPGRDEAAEAEAEAGAKGEEEGGKQRGARGESRSQKDMRSACDM
jgi:hypothetical protein